MGILLTERLIKVRKVTQFLLAVAMVVLVSGILPILVQGYAWLDMSQKAGGLSMLPEIVTNAEPCEICKAASKLQESSRGNGDSPTPTKNTEFVKPVFTATDEPTFKLGPIESDTSAIRRRDVEAGIFKGRSDSPEVPPPRVSAA